MYRTYLLTALRIHIVNGFENMYSNLIRVSRPFNTALPHYREKVVSSDDLLEWLRPFCGDDSLAVKPRIKVLQILEQAFHLSDEDSKLLVYFRTQAVLRACWPETKVLILIAVNYSVRLFLCEDYMMKCWFAIHGCDRTCWHGN